MNETELWSFSLILDGADPDTDYEEHLFGAGFDDALPVFRFGYLNLQIDREARTLSAAVRSALRDLEKTPFRLSRLEPGDLGSRAVHQARLIRFLNSRLSHP